MPLGNSLLNDLVQHFFWYLVCQQKINGWFSVKDSPNLAGVTMKNKKFIVAVCL